MTERVPIQMQPEELRHWFQDHRDNWVLYLDDDMSPQSLRVLYERHIHSLYCDWGIISEIAAHANTPSDVLVALAGTKRWEVLLALACNPNLPVRVIERLSHSRYTDVVVHVIWQPNTPVEVLHRLAEKGRTRVIRGDAKRALAQREEAQPALGP